MRKIPRSREQLRCYRHILKLWRVEWYGISDGDENLYTWFILGNLMEDAIEVVKTEDPDASLIAVKELEFRYGKDIFVEEQS